MREISNAEWDDIHDRLKEKDAEIERLKRDNAFLKVLLTRAADVLEKYTAYQYTAYPIGMVMSLTLRESGREIIAQLRKAAR